MFVFFVPFSLRVGFFPCWWSLLTGIERWWFCGSRSRFVWCLIAIIRPSGLLPPSWNRLRRRTENSRSSEILVLKVVFLCAKQSPGSSSLVGKWLFPFGSVVYKWVSIFRVLVQRKKKVSSNTRVQTTKPCCSKWGRKIGANETGSTSFGRSAYAMSHGGSWVGARTDRRTRAEKVTTATGMLCGDWIGLSQDGGRDSYFENIEWIALLVC